MICCVKPTNLADPEINKFLDLKDVLVENENLQHRYQFNTQESLLVPNIPTSEGICIAPEEGKSPNPLLTGESSEPLGFPYLF